MVQLKTRERGERICAAAMPFEAATAVLGDTMTARTFFTFLAAILLGVQPALAEDGVVTLDLGYATDEEWADALDAAADLFELIMRNEWEWRIRGVLAAAEEPEYVAVEPDPALGDDEFEHDAEDPIPAIEPDEPEYVEEDQVSAVEPYEPWYIAEEPIPAMYHDEPEYVEEDQVSAVEPDGLWYAAEEPIPATYPDEPEYIVEMPIPAIEPDEPENIAEEPIPAVEPEELGRIAGEPGPAIPVAALGFLERRGFSLSAGVGGMVGGHFTRYGIRAGELEAGQSISQFEYGLFAFFDATFITLGFIWQNGVNNFDEPVAIGGVDHGMSRSGQGWQTVLGFSALLRFPFRLGSRFTVSPLLGIDYHMVFLYRRTDGYGLVYNRDDGYEETDLDGGAFSLSDWNSFIIRLGVGAEFDLTNRLFLRGDLLFGIRLMTNYERKNLALMQHVSGDPSPDLGGLSFGPSLRLSLGWRFYTRRR